MKIGWKVALGFALAAFCLYYAFHKTDWPTAIEQAKHAKGHKVF